MRFAVRKPYDDKTYVYLWLDGPFEYPKWTPNHIEAAQFTMGRAYQWVQITGGEAVPIG